MSLHRGVVIILVMVLFAAIQFLFSFELATLFSNEQSVFTSAADSSDVRIQELTKRIQDLEAKLSDTESKLDKCSQQRTSMEVSMQEECTSKDVISALESFTIDKEEAILKQLHGREYSHRLTCPSDERLPRLLRKTKSKIVIGYHVGMVNNWQNIVKDQLHILHACGLEAVTEHLYLSYSNNATIQKELKALHQILGRYPVLANKTTYLYNNAQPIEGAAIRALHRHCQTRYPNQTFPPLMPLLRDDSDEKLRLHNQIGETVVFYFHTKGSSRWGKHWERNTSQPYGYANSLHWRKYMEYFTLERPSICTEQIIQKGKWGCGVYWAFNKMYGGNFWVLSGQYLASLTELPTYAISDRRKRYRGEDYITEDLRSSELTKEKFDKGEYQHLFHSLHQPERTTFYVRKIQPQEYDDFHYRWYDFDT